MTDARRPAAAARTPARDRHAEITDRIVAALEAGTLPWRRPWDTAKAGGPMAPRNAVTGRRYRGINALLLAMADLALGAPDPRWLTYRQAAAAGCQVRRGERGSRVVFFRQLIARERDAGQRGGADGAAEGGDGEPDARAVPLLRLFTVFHASQVDGLPPFRPPGIAEAPWRAPEAGAAILRRSGAAVRVGGGRAFYSPATDHIQLPPEGAFATAEGWMATALHELAHWSGAPSRLHRDLTGRFGGEGYAKEELRAELASCFVNAELGLPCDVPNHASYVADWLDVLRGDKREVFRAAADAQRIADYLLGFHPDFARRGRGRRR